MPRYRQYLSLPVALALTLALAAPVLAQAVPLGTPTGGVPRVLVAPEGTASKPADAERPTKVAPSLPASAAAAAAINATRTFTYQGLLRNAGLPVNGPCDLMVSLWDAAGGGTQIGTTQSLTTTAADGLFTATLNTGDQFGAAAFDGRAVWVEIAVRSPAGAGAFTTLTPRQMLSATPLAAGLVPHSTQAAGDTYSGYPVATVLATPDTWGNPMGLMVKSSEASNYIGTFSPAGIWSDCGNGMALFATTNTGTAVFGGAGTAGKAGYFQGDVVVTGKLEVQRFKTAVVLNSVGPLPLTSYTFTTSGGTLLLSYSGSGYSTVASRFIGMEVRIDGQLVDQTGIFSNPALTHMAFVSKQWVLTGIAAGSHTIALTTLSGTSTDPNDIFNVSVTELPY